MAKRPGTKQRRVDWRPSLPGTGAGAAGSQRERTDPDAAAATAAGNDHVQIGRPPARRIPWQPDPEVARPLPGLAASVRRGTELRALAHAAGILIGLAAGWQWCGLRTILAAEIDPLPATTAMLGVIALFCAAVGPSLPGHILSLVAGLVHRYRHGDIRRQEEITGPARVLRAITRPDPSLPWLSLSLVSAVAGLVTLVALFMARPALLLYRYLLQEFFWTSLTLAALEWIGVTALAGLVWLSHGLLVATLAPVSAGGREPQRAMPGTTGDLLAGLGLAWLTHGFWASRGLAGEREVLLGVLPLFILAALATRISHRVERRVTDGGADALGAGTASGADALIWLSLVIWGMGATLAAAGRLGCDAGPPLAPQRWVHNPGSYLLLTGLGVFIAMLHARHRQQSTGGCGLAMWAAGFGSGAAATATAVWPWSSAGGVVQLGLIALPLGYALHYLERAWLARAGSHTAGFIQLSTALLAGAGLGLIAAQWWALPVLGPMGTLAAGALLFLAFGGLLQIYEENRSSRTQRLRLALVFASLALAILLFPSNTRRWARWERSRPALRPTVLTPAWRPAPDEEGLRHVCLIGVEARVAAAWSADLPGHVDILPFAGGQAVPADLSLRQRRRGFDIPAFRAVRLLHRRYQLVYQQGRPIGANREGLEYTADWLLRLAERTAAGGQIILDIPLAGATPEALIVIAATFSHTAGGTCTWAVAGAGNSSRLLLRSHAGESVFHRRPGAIKWHPIASLAGSQWSANRLHSVRRNRLAETPSTSTADATRLSEWLARRAREAGGAVSR